MLRNKIACIIIAIALLYSIPYHVNATDFICIAKDVQLPYPGMLSTHPLYFLKKIRDKILEQFITDPNKRMEYYLFESEKYMNEVLIHFNHGRNDAALNMSKRSMNFLTLFVSVYAETAKNNKPLPIDFACNFYSIIEFQIKKYDEIARQTPNKEMKKELNKTIELLRLNKDGFDNLLTTMHSKRITSE